ncbi:venom carboxylesterase-6-like [Lutzomyia longipalpis]|uniref:venom carboxylesterase-6-like n=1 Tax=Lutzomyia longipalpis TaxID=7200 RepID=UPI00248457DF|nr:venom carboxylesterase-6-like [Lutzomyia longipalpis]
MKFLLICAFLVINVINAEEVIVNLPNGPIRGVKNGPMFIFKSIPYAEPPVGEKRFEPVGINREKWSGVRNATDEGMPCMQLSHMGYSQVNPIVFGMEDCLFLSVFTSSLDSGKKLPVIFYIHGGAFMFGTGSFMSPERLFKYQEFVFVIFNYRVGPLGFLSTENEVVPGNMGMKDQVVALQWVQENIHLFGGDPNRVMINGVSAGGASTHLHYFSPLSAGLFHRGFSQSGSALNPWAITENARSKATTLAAHLECPTQDPKAMIECMKAKPAEDIVRGSKLFLPWLYNPFTPFGVVVEKKSPQPFLSDYPEAILRAGKVTDVPWIASLTDAEGNYPVIDYLVPSTKLDQLNNRWEELAPTVLDFAGTVVPQLQPEVGRSVREFYLQKEQISMQNVDKLVAIFSDRHFCVGISLSARLHGQFTSASNYLMYLTFPSEAGLGDLFAPGIKLKGCGHGDDQTMLFVTPVRTLPLTEKEEKFVELFAGLLVKYAAGHDPEMAGVQLKAITSSESMDYLHIKSPNEITLEKTPGFGNEKFWYSLPIAEWNLSLSSN